MDQQRKTLLAMGATVAAILFFVGGDVGSTTLAAITHPGVNVEQNSLLRPVVGWAMTGGVGGMFGVLLAVKAGGTLLIREIGRWLANWLHIDQAETEITTMSILAAMGAIITMLNTQYALQ